MMDWKALQKAPLWLDENAIYWVQQTLESLSIEKMAGQLFFVELTGGETSANLDYLADMGAGGIVYRPDAPVPLRDKLAAAACSWSIPPLLGGNLESGANGCVTGGTDMGNQMLLAAGGDPQAGYKLGSVCCGEAGSIGVNCAFAPVADLDFNFRNPITNVRTCGKNPDTVIAIASGYLKAAKENGFAAAIKHFPGDGMDELDQHFTISENNLDRSAWEASYGEVYRALITQGAPIVMAGHISLPEISRQLDPGIDPNTPTTLNPAILKGLLRHELGFNGMILTDSTNMLGFLTYCPRESAIPRAIAAGCDMILFNKNLPEDVSFLLKGLKSGLLERERLEEAAARILAVKASIRLHVKQQKGTLVPAKSALRIIGSEIHKSWAKQAAEQGITLVKDTQQMLPLTPKRYPRLYLNVLQADDSPQTQLRRKCVEYLTREGFTVTLRDRQQGRDMAWSMEDNIRGVSFLKNNFDAAVYIAAYATPSNKLSVRLDWTGMHARGNDAPWFLNEIPTLFISLGNPYHLFDVPYIKTYINAYAYTETILDSLIDKLVGRQEFQGVSVTDPFCGRGNSNLL